MKDFEVWQENYNGDEIVLYSDYKILQDGLKFARKALEEIEGIAQGIKDRTRQDSVFENAKIIINIIETLEGREKKVTQYHPTFCEGFENEVCKFTNEEDLLEIGFIKKFSEHVGFYRYSISRNCLMAEYDEGANWWVCAQSKDFEGLDLPIWDSKEAQKSKKAKENKETEE